MTDHGMESESALKCPMCNDGELVKGKAGFTMRGHFYGEYSAEVCNKCGAEFFDEDSSRAIEKKAKELGHWGTKRKMQ